LTGYWSTIRSSADGNRLAVVVGQGGPSAAILTSTNGGATWTSNAAPAHGYSSLASSADGGFLATLVQEGNLFTTSNTIPPQLQMALSGTNAVVSWIIPSRTFTLLQNTNLSATNWTSVTSLLGLNLFTLCNELSLPATNAQSYFRLSSP